MRILYIFTVITCVSFIYCIVIYIDVVNAHINKEYIDRSFAKIALLDKITAHVDQIILEVNKIHYEHHLRFFVERCAETIPKYAPESVMFIDIRLASKESLISNQTTIFRGWMFASSPGLSAVEHPVYDIWLLSCKTNP